MKKRSRFNGLFRAINSQSSNSTYKQILTDIIDLLRGKGNGKNSFQIITKCFRQRIQIGHKAHRKIRIIVPIALVGLVAVLIIGISFIYLVEEINAEPCTVPYVRTFSEETVAPTDIVVNPNQMFSILEMLPGTS